ncbi:sodium/glutamate symporter [Utexia brackfieldae]|uniref:sodium/glutamate symporter n=1 Tax=Utexia brackfieldae TaxID=3074108 RepID=UPI00370D3F1A
MIDIDIYNTLVCTCLVLLFGRVLVNRISLFQQFTLPAPVVGGILVAVILLFVKLYLNIQINFNGDMTSPLMLMFFASIGLNANVRQLMLGGRMIVLFLIVVIGLLFLQNILGIGLATLLGEDPLLGLLVGSITLSGGHGTGAAWGEIFANQYHYASALEVAMACATLSLILGGLIGGPIARFLVERRQPSTESDPLASADNLTAFEEPKVRRAISAYAVIETIAMLSICLSLGNYIAGFLKGSIFELPSFVCVLFVGVVLNNVIAFIPGYNLFERAVSVVGNVCLSLFLTIALMSLKLWELTNLALPMVVILTVQTVVMALYAIFVTYRVMGRDYNAAVLVAGHCGFGLGATPTAIANMQAVTDRYGPAPVAFIVVPMVGAFFIDLVNAVVIKGFLWLPIFN